MHQVVQQRKSCVVSVVVPTNCTLHYSLQYCMAYGIWRQLFAYDCPDSLISLSIAPKICAENEELK